MSDYIYIKWELNQGEDWIPTDSIPDRGTNYGVIHSWYWRRKWRKAKYDVTRSGEFAELDYTPYDDFNDKHGVLLGTSRIQLCNSVSKAPSGKLWWVTSPDRKFSLFDKSEVLEKTQADLDIFELQKKRDLLPTTKQQLIDARRGQGQFREEVLRAWNCTCPITGATTNAVLRASHIKPWSECNDEERLNPDNGLALCANVDALFDRFLITIDKDGRIERSTGLTAAELTKLGIPKQARITLSPEQDKFMEYHRSEARRRSGLA